ncbi:MAG: hypothetical protein H7323_15640 [Frankiales bacterium]|nr:hypothetical protein [Frankiales bacterium]
MDTPIFDVLLADRLAGARRAVEQAEADATAFRAALDRGQTQALEQLAEQQARALVAERTRALTEQVAGLERQLHHTEQLAAAAQAELDKATEPAAPPAPPIVVADPPPQAAAATPRAAGRKAADQGPTGGDIPVVPSVKELLTTTRSASWLDTLLGSRR